MHLYLAAVLALDLDLVGAAAGAVPIVSIVSLDLGDGSATTHRSDRSALGLLGVVGAGEPLLGVSAAVIVRSEIVSTWVIVEASWASAIVASKVIRAGVVVLGDRRRCEDQRGPRATTSTSLRIYAYPFFLALLICKPVAELNDAR